MICVPGRFDGCDDITIRFDISEPDMLVSSFSGNIPLYTIGSVVKIA